MIEHDRDLAFLVTTARLATERAAKAEAEAASLRTFTAPLRESLRDVEEVRAESTALRSRLDALAAHYAPHGDRATHLRTLAVNAATVFAEIARNSHAPGVPAWAADQVAMLTSAGCPPRPRDVVAATKAEPPKAEPLKAEAEDVNVNVEDMSLDDYAKWVAARRSDLENRA